MKVFFLTRKTKSPKIRQTKKIMLILITPISRPSASEQSKLVGLRLTPFAVLCVCDTLKCFLAKSKIRIFYFRLVPNPQRTKQKGKKQKRFFFPPKRKMLGEAQHCRIFIVGFSVYPVRSSIITRT